ncbi:hypothetical protein [Stieleria varia]|uniref:Chromosome partition protein Smc n=1 Tax=Stieleria varia TaxID=2528005 RepID=A0A5C6B806_9BACT|nr:hypothetical protein [Stieleria varia]TWU08203.1 hypothetical protein Pla52n_07850 [Stieleria varia]
MKHLLRFAVALPVLTLASQCAAGGNPLLTRLFSSHSTCKPVTLCSEQAPVIAEATPVETIVSETPVIEPVVESACCQSGQAVVTGTGSIASSNITPAEYAQDNPSELNILLTTELVQLREQVKQLQETQVAQDEALAKSEQLITAEKKSHEEHLKKLDAQMKRIEAAEKQAASAKQQLADAQKKHEQLVSKLNAEIKSAEESAKAAVADAKQQSDAQKERADKLQKQNQNLKKNLEQQKKRADDLAAKAAEVQPAKEEAPVEPQDDAPADKPQDDKQAVKDESEPAPVATEPKEESAE